MDNELYSKLTSSGKAGLRTVRDSFTDTVLEMAYQIAIRNNTGESEISLRDVMEAKNTILQNRSFPRYRRYLLMSFSLILVGLIYILIGYYLFGEKDPRILAAGNILKEGDFYVTIIGVMCVLFALFLMFYTITNETFLYKKIRKEKIYVTSDMDTLLIQWQRIEEIGRLMLEKDGVITDGNKPELAKIHKKISESLSEEYKKRMMNILSIRNEFLHGRLTHSSKEIGAAISDANDIIFFLETKSTN